MYSSAALIDIHSRMHRNMAALLKHCSGLSQALLHSRLDGFGFPTVHLQLFHTLSTEWFWLGVIRRAELPRDEREKYNSVPLLEEYRQHVASLTEGYLRGVSEKELNERTRFEIDPGDFENLIPALVFMRVVTHQYHHQGQTLA